MTRKKKLLVAFIAPVTCLILVLVFQKKPGNFADALIEKQGDKFVISMRSRGRIMIHDPITLLINMICPTTFVKTENLFVSADQGVFDGKDLSFAYIKNAVVGQVTIVDQDMTVYLHWDDADRGPLFWNGKYHLSPGFARQGVGEAKPCYLAE